jgi:hypothetical protein
MTNIDLAELCALSAEDVGRLLAAMGKDEADEFLERLGHIRAWEIYEEANEREKAES